MNCEIVYVLLDFGYSLSIALGISSTL